MSTLFIIIIFLIPIFLLKIKQNSSKKLPPGSLGFPIIGQSLSLLQNMRANTAEKWLDNRIKKYGPISKLSLFGKPTVFIYGQAANKFIFSSDSNTLANNQTQSVKMLLGDRCLLELSGEDHKRVRNALMSFLKPESLKEYVGKMDEEVRLHIQNFWEGKQEVKVLPLMKTLTFNIICSLLFGIERGARRDEFVDRFQDMILGMWSIPINLPFTRFNRSIKASTRIQNMLKDLISEKRMEIEKKCGNTRQDLITCMLSNCNQNNGGGAGEISEKEIVDNVMLVMTAGHDTSSVLLTFLMKLLANDPSVYESLLQEQEEIAKSKKSGELLTWEDLAKMKYTWRVALETMRLYPPIFGGFRKAVKDIEYDGYLIPKGWQIFWVTSMTQMDKGIFQEPRKFDPTRFENPSSIPPYCHVPFGGGPRICPGYEFARIETLVTIHYLVTHFTWKLNSDNFFSRDPMPVPTQGLPITITPKKPITK
ncbi:cytochrome P450 716B1-like [Mercurialis annua]|uniref:cytochrome P450 716B1-like n=1 Tax=Mercurialis annua TaxID=3986 RepID=UPI00215EFC6A|nr:cytochrome P450 716B1-like [Mercurialis annua]